ncbi:MAG: hypothetical protein KUG79_04900 [Pseudomonadales bacterium]|nr:hypothetical protein [Pseudomonadales bacterium]
MSELSDTEKALNVANYGSRFFILGQVGAVIVAMTSLHPFFAIYNIPAAVVLTLTIVWDLWKSASKQAKRIMALVTLAAGVVIQINSIGKFILPEVADPGMAYMGAITMTGGAIGHLIIIIAAIQGLKAVKYMDGPADVLPTASTDKAQQTPKTAVTEAQ